MNCIEFRRMLRAGVAASGAPEEMREHGLSCANCSAGFAEQQAFEAELGRTLAFPVDTDFAERMVAAVHAVDQPTALPRRDRRRILAIAASVIAAGGVGSYLWIDRNDIGVCHQQ